MKFNRRILSVVFLGFLTVTACVRTPLKQRSDAMRLTADIPPISDDLPISTLADAIREELERLKTSNSMKLSFGPRVVSRDDYISSLQYLLDVIDKVPPSGSGFPVSLSTAIKEGFDFYEVYGRDRWGEVLLTSYYEPEIPGSLTSSSQFPQALLRSPADLVDVEVGKYDDRFSNVGQIRGRIVDNRDHGGKLSLVPYYSRAEIDEKKVLAGKNLELCWVDPVDAFFMQIQGSGTVLLADNQKLHLGYDDQNGEKYQAIGSLLTHLIPLEKVTLQSLETYLKSLPLDKLRGVLGQNPSYIFFRKLDGPPQTSLGTTANPGRTVASDVRYFPKGALALLSFKKPSFENATTQDASGWDPVTRFVLDQDKGGAIKGGGHVDLFWGTGADAKRSAGLIKQRARLYYLAPKETLLARLRPSAPVENESKPPTPAPN